MTSPTWCPPGPASPPGGCSKARRPSCCGWRPSSASGLSARRRAVQAVSDAVRRARAGVSDPDRPDRLVPVPRADRRRQDRAGQGAGGVPVRRRAGHGPDRHERVRREALGRPADRRPARLRGLRGGRPAHRGGAAPAVLRGAARRGGEGAPGGLRRPAPGARRRAAHRRPGPHGGLQEHDPGADLEPGVAVHRRSRVRRRGGQAGRGDGRGPGRVQAGVPEPARRRDRVRRAVHQRAHPDRRPAGRRGWRRGWPAGGSR